MRSAAGRNARFSSLVPSVASVALAVAGFLAPSVAHADIQHVVGRGHTIEAIANRYHVSAKAIVEANHLTDVKHLHPGDVLVIPTKDSPAGSTKAKADTKADAASKKTEAKEGKDGKDGKGKDGKGKDKKGSVASLAKDGQARETTNYAMKPKTPGVIHVKRLATNEEFDIHVSDRKTKVGPATLKTFEKMMRSPNGMAHPIEPRLISLLAIVSNHFGSRKIEVVSGFRPFTPTQYNPHSNHMHGKAVDFRVVGVPNETLRDFCRTLKNVGCGYYPNSVFVHMDVREQSAFWIDYSKPGEAPRYNAPNVDADEGASDVHDENHPATGETPAASPSDAPAPSSPSGSDSAPKAEPAKPEGSSEGQ